MSKPSLHALEELTAKAFLGGAHFKMDEYAKEIFDLWFNGNAPDEVIFDNPKWADYMKADKRLEKTIDDELVRYAKRVRDEALGAGKLLADGRIDVKFQPYKLQFHGEVGSPDGGYVTGYEVLHGSHKGVGDTQVSGTITIEQRTLQAPWLTVRFTNNTLVFNDKVDPNYTYASDVKFERLARNMSRALGQRPPKDYILRIVWREPGAWIYDIPLQPEKPAPVKLKPYARDIK